MKGIITIIIMTTTYGFIEILKTSLKGEKFYAIIPIISATFGAVLSLTIYYGIPELIGDANFFETFIIGNLSGLSATGTNQIAKQLKKLKNNSENNKN